MKAVAGTRWMHCTLVLIFAGSGAVHAGSPCATPPYGSTVSDYKAFISKWAATDIASLPTILENACRAKLEGGDRRPLYTVGLTDEEITAQDVARLADTWMQVNVAALHANTAAADDADRPRRYAIFMCIPDAARCQVFGGTRVSSDGPVPIIVFNSSAECMRYVPRLGPQGHTRDGRFPLPNGMWYECRSKAFDAWE